MFFCVFFENDKTDLRQIFFHGLAENTCFFTTCFEKQCTQPLRFWRPGTKNLCLWKRLFKF